MELVRPRTLLCPRDLSEGAAARLLLSSVLLLDVRDVPGGTLVFLATDEPFMACCRVGDNPVRLRRVVADSYLVVPDAQRVSALLVERLGTLPRTLIGARQLAELLFGTTDLEEAVYQLTGGALPPARAARPAPSTEELVHELSRLLMLRLAVKRAVRRMGDQELLLAILRSYCGLLDGMRINQNA